MKTYTRTLVTLVLTLVMCAAIANGETNIAVSQALAGYRTEQGWLELDVTITHTGDAVQAMLEFVTPTTLSESVVCARDVDLGIQTRVRVPLYCWSTQYAPEHILRLKTKTGTIIEELTVQLPDSKVLSEGGSLVAVVGKDSLGLRYPEFVKDQMPHKVRLARISTSQLPSASALYSTVRAVVWANPKPRLLTAAQREALLSYIRSGGTLVLSFAQGAMEIRDSFLEPLVPGRIESLSTTAFQPVADFASVPLKEPAEVSAVRLSSIDSAVIAGSMEMPLAVMRPFGNGVAFVLTFDVTKEPFHSWKGRLAFWQALLKLPEPKSVVQESAESYADQRIRFDEDHVYPELAIVHYLQNMRGKSAEMPLRGMVLFLLVYIIVIGPVDYYVLKAIKKQHFTWITFPVLTIVFTSVAIGYVYHAKGKISYLRTFTVVDVGENDVREVEQYTAVFSARDMTYDFVPKNPRTLLAPVSDVWSQYARRGFRLAQTSGYRIVSGEGTEVRDLTIPIWSWETISGKWQESGPPPLEIDLGYEHIGNGKRAWQGSIGNLLDRKIVRCEVITASGTRKCDTIEPGEKWEVSAAYDKQVEQYFAENQQHVASLNRHNVGSGSSPSALAYAACCAEVESKKSSEPTGMFECLSRNAVIVLAVVEDPHLGVKEFQGNPELSGMVVYRKVIYPNEENGYD